MTPSLAGEPDEFVQWQLVYFRSGARKSEVMGPIAEVAEQPRYPQSRRLLRVAAAAQAGACIRRAGASRAKSLPSAPLPILSLATTMNGFGAAARLSGQREDVLLKALRDFKSGNARRLRRRFDGGRHLRPQRCRHAGAGALHGDRGSDGNPVRERLAWQLRLAAPHFVHHPRYYSTDPHALARFADVPKSARLRATRDSHTQGGRFMHRPVQCWPFRRHHCSRRDGGRVRRRQSEQPREARTVQTTGASPPIFPPFRKAAPRPRR